MRLRKGIIISAAVLSMMACTSCGNSDKSKSATDAGNETTGESSAIMVNAKDQSDENATEAKTVAGTETKAESDKQEESGTDTADNKGEAVENNTEDNYENNGEDEAWDEADFSFDSILGIDQLDLNYEAHVAGFDGESFLYSVYIADGVTDEKVEEIQQAVADVLHL